MKLAVLVKEVPDTYGQRLLDIETGLLDRASSDRAVDEVSARALEVALSVKDRRPDTEVIVVLMGPAESEASLRSTLAMGADVAVHIVADSLVGADALLTARVLAAAVSRTGADAVISGAVSTDGAGGVIPVMISEVLGWPALTNLIAVELEDEVTGSRIVEDAVIELRADLPAVISVTDALPEARYPGFKGIMAAKRKTIDAWTPEDLDIVIDEERPASILTAVAARPARTAGIKIVDDGNAAAELARYLVDAGYV